MIIFYLTYLIHAGAGRSMNKLWTSFRKTLFSFNKSGVSLAGFKGTRPYLTAPDGYAGKRNRAWFSDRPI